MYCIRLYKDNVPFLFLLVLVIWLDFIGSLKLIAHLHSLYDIYDVADKMVITWIFNCSGGVVSHSFVLEARSKGVFTGPPAVVKYRVSSKSALQVCEL